MNFLHEKDLGDIILSLASVQAAGGGNYYIKNNPNAVKMLAPLIENQPYINECNGYSDQIINKSFVDFRNGGHPFGVPLSELHARWINQSVDLNKKWLFCSEDKKFNDKIIVNKTNRYNNTLFPWRYLVEILRDKILFVGTDQEYREFNTSYGNVNRLIINNYLELAIAINSCECFIGNQSSANCIAEGLKHNSILEVSLNTPDCIYNRDNTYYSYDGSIKKKIGSINIDIPAKEIKEYVDEFECPPSGWKYNINGNDVKSYCMKQLIQIIKQNNSSIDLIDIKNKIIEYTRPYIPLSYNNQLLINKINNVKQLIFP
jgi:hypothetical protein